MEFLIIIGFVAVYLLLQIYILPKMGVSTWMRDACQVTDKKKKKNLFEDNDWLLRNATLLLPGVW